MSIYDGPGRGRKCCSGCQKYVGVRSLVCPNCQASFSSTLDVAKSAIRLLVNPPPKPATVSSVTPAIVSEKKKDKETSKGSRLDRIAFLKKELIRELKNSSRMFGAEVIKEISDSVLTE